MANNLFIKNNIEKVSRGGYTDFLDPIERKQVINALKKMHIAYNEFIPFDGAEKTIIYSDEMPSVSLLKINSKQELKHSDILGSLFSHNISITKYGDIIVGDNYYLIVLDSIKKYLLTNFNKIGKHIIELNELDISLIKDYRIKFEEIEMLVSSLRLDNIVSTITNTSRKETEDLLNDKFVLVNYEINTKKTYLIKDDDIISIRRYGKYIFKGIIKRTIKGKYIVRICKYS